MNKIDMAEKMYRENSKGGKGKSPKYRMTDKNPTFEKGVAFTAQGIQNSNRTSPKYNQADKKGSFVGKYDQADKSGSFQAKYNM